MAYGRTNILFPFLSPTPTFFWKRSLHSLSLEHLDSSDAVHVRLIFFHFFAQASFGGVPAPQVRDCASCESASMTHLSLSPATICGAARGRPSQILLDLRRGLHVSILVVLAIGHHFVRIVLTRVIVFPRQFCITAVACIPCMPHRKQRGRVGQHSRIPGDEESGSTGGLDSPGIPRHLKKKHIRNINTCAVQSDIVLAIDKWDQTESVGKKLPWENMEKGIAQLLMRRAR